MTEEERALPALFHGKYGVYTRSEEAEALVESVFRWEWSERHPAEANVMGEKLAAYRRSLLSSKGRYRVNEFPERPGVMSEVLDTEVNRVVCYSTNPRNCERICRLLNEEEGT